MNLKINNSAWRLSVITLTLAVCFVSELKAQYYHTSGSRLFHVQEALTPRAGSTNWSYILDFHVTPGGYEPGDTPGRVEGGPFQSIRMNMQLDWSIIDYVTFAANLKLYNTINHYQQNILTDLPERVDANIVESLTFALKFGSLGVANDHFYLGALVTTKLPLAPQGRYNSFGNPYSAGGYEVGVYFLGSLYFDNFFPRETFSISANLGFYQYFDAGKNLSNSTVLDLSNPSNAYTSSIKYSLGLSLPVSIARFMVEFWGWAFASQPPVYAYTRENMAFVTGGVRLKVLDFLKVDVGVDFQVAGFDNDQTHYGDVDEQIINAQINKTPAVDPKNYTWWRVNFGVNLAISGSYSLVQFLKRQPPPIDFTAETRSAKVILKKIEEVSLDKLSLSERLNELRKRRQDIERNLQILNKILNQDGSSNEVFTPLREQEGVDQVISPSATGGAVPDSALIEKPSEIEVDAETPTLVAPPDVSPVQEPLPPLSEDELPVQQDVSPQEASPNDFQNETPGEDPSIQPEDGESEEKKTSPQRRKRRKRKARTPTPSPEQQTIEEEVPSDDAVQEEGYEEVINTVDTDKE